MKIADFRSDTVTKPTPDMLNAMMNAEVGDDVYGEDPTINKLEAKIAEMAGKEAAVFAASGSQSNLIGIMAHCERGDEYIVGQTAHTYLWEGGGAAVLGSVQPQPLDFESDGSLCLQKVELAIKPLDDHHARSKLLCLENTTNGKVLSLDYLKMANDFCHTHGLSMHLDGARVFNAAVKLQVELSAITQHFDTISLCLSKGLGAPVGSVLCGSKDLIRKAKRWRKVVGGAMRQAGILAAAGIYALDHHVQRLQVDHDNAYLLAEQLSQIDEIKVDKAALQTNILYVHTPPNYALLQAHLEQNGIKFPKQPRRDVIRLVTHLDVTSADIGRTVHLIKKFYAN